MNAAQTGKAPLSASRRGTAVAVSNRLCRRWRRAGKTASEDGRFGRRDPGNERDRHCQDQRTRGRGDQNGQSSDGVAREQPRTASDGEGDWKQQQRISIREADERRLCSMCRINQPNDACVRAFAGRSGRPKSQRFRLR